MSPRLECWKLTGLMTPFPAPTVTRRWGGQVHGPESKARNWGSGVQPQDPWARSMKLGQEEEP